MVISFFFFLGVLSSRTLAPAAPTVCVTTCPARVARANSWISDILTRGYPISVTSTTLVLLCLHMHDYVRRFLHRTLCCHCVAHANWMTQVTIRDAHQASLHFPFVLTVATGPLLHETGTYAAVLTQALHSLVLLVASLHLQILLLPSEYLVYSYKVSSTEGVPILVVVCPGQLC